MMKRKNNEHLTELTDVLCDLFEYHAKTVDIRGHAVTLSLLDLGSQVASVRSFSLGSKFLSILRVQFYSEIAEQESADCEVERARL